MTTNDGTTVDTETTEPTDEPEATPPPATTAVAKVEKAQPVPFVPRDTEELFRYARFMAQSKLVPDALRDDPYSVLHLMLYGRELGIMPAVAPASLHIIKGKISMDATEMLRRVIAAPVCEYIICTEQTDESATWATRRRGWPEGVTQTVTWTMERAIRAGLAGKDNWKRMPGTMLKRRAQTELIRDVYPDVISVYSTDEIDDDVRGVDGTLPPPPPPPPSVKDRIKAKRSDEDAWFDQSAPMTDEEKAAIEAEERAGE